MTSSQPPPINTGGGSPSVAPAVSVTHAPALQERKRLNSQALFGNEREIEIEHAGQLYRLRLTSLGKLILTK